MAISWRNVEELLDAAQKVQLGAPHAGVMPFSTAKGCKLVCSTSVRHNSVCDAAGALRDACALFLGEFLASEPRLAWTL